MKRISQITESVSRPVKSRAVTRRPTVGKKDWQLVPGRPERRAWRSHRNWPWSVLAHWWRKVRKEPWRASQQSPGRSPGRRWVCAAWTTRRDLPTSWEWGSLVSSAPAWGYRPVSRAARCPRDLGPRARRPPSVRPSLPLVWPGPQARPDSVFIYIYIGKYE